MRDRVSFQPLLASASTANIKVFIKGVHTRADIEAEFRRFKKDFDASKFGVNVQ